eukprot:TRINITY_DN45536_c0_g1_i1.p1 TRINITY_DN45536_c0_g1~~TRINITY_DN45536_c0_g1_i1.p1  ORF type:complete len:391 (+),score=79.65 TRINITY_DN45536_c0_g1_i1:84-1175(+)
MGDIQQLLAVSLQVLDQYDARARQEVARVNRNLTGLSADDKASLVRSVEEQVRVTQEAVDTNKVFLDHIRNLIREEQANAGSQGDAAGKRCGPYPTSKSVENFMHTTVREWSKEGQKERGECFERLLGALDAHLATKRDGARAAGEEAPSVLCPGTMLARLPYEVNLRGYRCESCESRPLLFFGSELIRRQGSCSEALLMQPFALNTCNRFKAEDHVRRVPVPDVSVNPACFPPVRFGDFSELYEKASTRNTFDAVLTAFAIDASPNVLRYVRTVAHLVREGGMWANFGPLAYDADHDEAHSNGVELSWEELKHAISHFFEVKEDTYIDAFHASNMESMMQLQYSCVYFSAVRNSVPCEGIGS